MLTAPGILFGILLLNRTYIHLQPLLSPIQLAPCEYYPSLTAKHSCHPLKQLVGSLSLGKGW